jgi:hypothetical protein
MGDTNWTYVPTQNEEHCSLQNLGPDHGPEAKQVECIDPGLAGSTGSAPRLPVASTAATPNPIAAAGAQVAVGPSTDSAAWVRTHAESTLASPPPSSLTGPPSTGSAAVPTAPSPLDTPFPGQSRPDLTLPNHTGPTSTDPRTPAPATSSPRLPVQAPRAPVSAKSDPLQSSLVDPGRQPALPPDPTPPGWENPSRTSPQLPVSNRPFWPTPVPRKGAPNQLPPAPKPVLPALFPPEPGSGGGGGTVCAPGPFSGLQGAEVGTLNRTSRKRQRGSGGGRASLPPCPENETVEELTQRVARLEHHVHGTEQFLSVTAILTLCFNLYYCFVHAFSS